MRMIFVNLPVKDLEKSKSFFTALGFSINPQFTNDDAACVVIDENIFAMLLTEPFFQGFLAETSQIADAAKTTEVLTCLSCANKEEVDALADKALAAGGSFWKEPMDMGFMYGRSFQDPDNHVWELNWMDPAAVAQHQS
jgi:predicted lactoylglutathione lyase